MRDSFSRIIIYTLAAALMITIMVARGYSDRVNMLTAADTERVLSAAGWHKGVVKDPSGNMEIPPDIDARAVAAVDGETGWIELRPAIGSSDLLISGDILYRDSGKMMQYPPADLEIDSQSGTHYRDDSNYGGEAVETPGSSVWPRPDPPRRDTPASPPPCAVAAYNLGLKDLFILESHGAPWAKGRLWADIRLSTGEVQHLEAPMVPTRFEVSRWVVRRDKRIRFAPRHPRAWRMGWSGGCGFGVTITGDTEPLCALLWGVQF